MFTCLPVHVGLSSHHIPKGCEVCDQNKIRRMLKLHLVQDIYHRLRLALLPHCTPHELPKKLSGIVVRLGRLNLCWYISTCSADILTLQSIPSMPAMALSMHTATQK